ncbi:MAG: S1/P1 nuclease [Pseudomonadota bacterium]|nr:S1/P1 nuclease [Pseudomonadota bacterium]
MPDRFLRLLGPLSPLFAILPGATPGAAYWEYGHQTVARIALATVRPAPRAKNSGSSWPRQVARHARVPGNRYRVGKHLGGLRQTAQKLGQKSRFRFAFNWHFQDVDVCKPFDLVALCKNGNCLSVQIVRQQARLADRHLPLADRLQALAFLTHLVGDLSQPLHAGEHDDQWGNKVRAGYGMIAARTNLHGIWDGCLAERAISTPPGGPLGLLHTSPAAKRRAMIAGNLTDGSRDSWLVTRDL